MKKTFRKLFWPILHFFEKGEGEYNYDPSHRKILLIVGVFFSLLAGVAIYTARFIDDVGIFIPILVFGGAGLLCLLVALLGSDRAVATIWKAKGRR